MSPPKLPAHNTRSRAATETDRNDADGQAALGRATQHEPFVGTTPGDTLSAAEARSALIQAVKPVSEREWVSLFAATGRFLAEDVVSHIAVPPHDNAAMDGYAVFASDLAAAPEGLTLLPVTGRVPAGGRLDRRGQAGEAIRIFTGAPMPLGFDTVVPQELCRALPGNRVLVPARPCGENVRSAGEDIKPGAIALHAGTRLRPQHVGVAAAIGRAHVEVYRQPRIALFSTGDELREPGAGTGPGADTGADGTAIHDSNRAILAGLLSGLGCIVQDFGIIPDRPDALHAALTRAITDCDAVLTSGGVSTGEEDHVRSVVAALGHIAFWRVAIRPGRPLAFGRIGSVPFLGLPGNPVSVMVTFFMFARPLLQTLAGGIATPPLDCTVPAGFTLHRRGGRREWLRATLRRTPEGITVADRFAHDGSGILTSMTASDGLIELPETLEQVKIGDNMTFIPYSELLS